MPGFSLPMIRNLPLLTFSTGIPSMGVMDNKKHIESLKGSTDLEPDLQSMKQHLQTILINLELPDDSFDLGFTEDHSPNIDPDKFSWTRKYYADIKGITGPRKLAALLSATSLAELYNQGDTRIIPTYGGCSIEYQLDEQPDQDSFTGRIVFHGMGNRDSFASMEIRPEMVVDPKTKKQKPGFRFRLSGLMEHEMTNIFSEIATLTEKKIWKT